MNWTGVLGSGTDSVRCGMNQWHTKPCSKANIHKIVNEARDVLLGAKATVEKLSDETKEKVAVGLGI